MRPRASSEIDARLIERPTPIEHGVAAVGDDLPPRLARPRRSARGRARRDRRRRRRPRRLQRRRLCPPSLHHEEAKLMRYLPLSDADRSEMLRVIGAGSIDELFRDVPEEARLKGPIDGLPMHASEMAVERHMTALVAQEHGRGRRALLPRLRRLQAPHPGERRPYHPARRVPDQLHALPARDRAGHAADDVRVPDAGRAAVRLRGRQCVDVRRLDRDVGSDPDGAPHHAPEQDDHLVGRAPALCQRREDDGASSPRTRSTPRCRS